MRLDFLRSLPAFGELEETQLIYINQVIKSHSRPGGFELWSEGDPVTKVRPKTSLSHGHDAEGAFVSL